MNNSEFWKVEINETAPLPNKRTILGGPLNAENRRVIRPFSRTCETVSIPELHGSVPIVKEQSDDLPLPIKSSYQTSLALLIRKLPFSPLGDRFT